jgi:hypothetical protein
MSCTWNVERRACVGRRATSELGLLLAAALLRPASSARAYDLPRQDGGGSDIQHGFIGGQFALGTRLHDLRRQPPLSLQYAGELGFKIVSAQDHRLFVGRGAEVSPQRLEAHLIDDFSTVVFAFGGIRYIPGAVCVACGTGTQSNPRAISP